MLKGSGQDEMDETRRFANQERFDGLVLREGDREIRTEQKGQNEAKQRWAHFRSFVPHAKTRTACSEDPIYVTSFTPFFDARSDSFLFIGDDLVLNDLETVV